MQRLFSRFCPSKLSFYSFRLISSAPKIERTDLEKIRQKRNGLFSEEKERQLKWIARIEKIEVEIFGRTAENGDEDVSVCKLAMNKNLSTPYNCALRKFFYFCIFIKVWELE